MHFVTLIALTVVADLQRKFLTSDALSTLRHHWPRGLYGLPMAITGCPKSRDFEWQTGYRFQDLEDNTKHTSRSAKFHLAAHIVNGDVDQMYCIKDTVVKDKKLPLWPKGKYCIYQRGTQCPETDGKFEAGFVLWDDENGSENHKNLNRKSGVLPAGKFDNDTLIRFCCQSSGSQTNPINLPVDDPFYLIFYKDNTCQEVFGTFHVKENIRYDTEETNNHDAVKVPYPARAVEKSPYIDYCYYQPCRWHLSGLNGSFTSPHHPNPYMNNANCEWIITVPRNHVIELQFKSISLQFICIANDICSCDYIKVSEVDRNGRIDLMIKYCMNVNNPSPLRSNSSVVIVYFRTNSNALGRGFRATYKAIALNESTMASSSVTVAVTRNIVLPTKRQTPSTSYKPSGEVQFTRNISEKPTDFIARSTLSTVPGHVLLPSYTSCKSFVFVTKVEYFTVSAIQMTKPRDFIARSTVKPDSSHVVSTSHISNTTFVFVTNAQPESEFSLVLVVTVLGIFTCLLLVTLFIVFSLWLHRRLRRRRKKPSWVKWSLSYDATKETVRLDSSSFLSHPSVDIYGHHGYSNNNIGYDVAKDLTVNMNKRLALKSPSERSNLQEHKRSENVLYEEGNKKSVHCSSNPVYATVESRKKLKPTKIGENPHIYEGLGSPRDVKIAKSESKSHIYEGIFSPMSHKGISTTVKPNSNIDFCTLSFIN